MKNYSEIIGASIMFFIILVACIYQSAATVKMLIITIDPFMVELMTGA
ncbi:hypothetical protein Ares1_0068 [Vibrio phage Ares1]|nr:hypothetical protein Ares1_0068 [Vibrio phage Ares1]